MKKKYLVILILIFALKINNVQAYSFSIPTISSGGGNGGPPTASPDGWPKTSGKYTYSCSFEYNISGEKYANIVAYDKQGKIVNSNSVNPTISIKAGTSIGIDIWEHQYIDGAVTKVTAERTYEEKTIKGYWVYDCSELATKRTCEYVGYYYSWQTGYSNVEDSEVVTKTEAATGYYKSLCESNSASKLNSIINATSLVPSYSLNLHDPNNINNTKTTPVSNPSCQKCYEGKKCCDFYYLAKKTCINVKTGDIIYKTNNSECKDEEIEVPKYGGKWQYFIPLNLKSNMKFELSLNSNSNANLNKDECEKLIKEDNQYASLLIKPDKSSFSSVRSVALDELKKVKGCFLASVIRISANQEFYNEESNNIRGYGSYFRPIDINNPFPNGLNTNSYWYDNKKNKMIDLKNAAGDILDIKKSYNQLYYRVDLVNSKLDAVKKFNIESTESDGIYTSWKAMNKDGTSNFVRDYINIKKVKDKSFYKLGCGPANSTWRECGRP